MKCQEFDYYAKEYTGGMENFVKRLLGGSLGTFIERKVGWLLRELAMNPLNCVEADKEIQVLDFGCGTGELLRYLRKLKFKGKIEGCDVSSSMLQEAVRRWDEGDIPKFYLINDEGKLPFLENSYELIIANCVFHHINPSRYLEVLKGLIQTLKRGGRIMLFEHNPFNPLTCWVVNRTSIDRNATLVTADKIKKIMLLAGFSRIRINYFLFFPPRIYCKWLRLVESYLGFLPLGGEYVVEGEKID